MALEIIDTGEIPNDGRGDPLRTAFDKINNNFTNLYSLATSESSNPTVVELINPTGQPVGNINSITIGNAYITNKFDSSASNPVIIRQKSKATRPTVTSVPTVESNMVMFGPYGNQEYINIGATPNDGSGDPLRTAFYKINNNFSNLFLTGTTTSTAYTLGPDPNQVIFEVPVSSFYQAEFQIRSSDSGTPDMQDITLSASLTNNLAGVKFSAHSTIFEGNAICRYDMDVSDNKVRILINPLADIGIEHFIAAYITYPVPVTQQGVEIALDGYANNYLLATETNLILTTEN